MIEDNDTHILGNGPATGVVMKEAVRRAVRTIQNLRLTFEVTKKPDHTGELNDLFTTADTAAQEVYLRLIRECFPGVGVIGEEGHLSIPASEGLNAYFTIDPLDGTRAFVRGQSHGVGSMIALVVDDHVVAAYVADVNTSEIYGYRPGSDRVWRISSFDTAKELAYERKNPLRASYALLRDPAEKYSKTTQLLLKNGRFENHLVDGGSIGIWLARLWKGEVAAAIIPPGRETPWDSTPIIGISKMLGYTFLRPSKQNGRWEFFEPALPKEKFERDHDVLIVHGRDLGDITDLIDTP